MTRGLHKHRRRASASIALPAAAGLLLAGAAAEHAPAASVYSFERVEANAPVDSSANYQLTIDSFTDNGDEWVSFRFDHNQIVTEIDQASISRVFFQDLGNLFWDGSDEDTLNAHFNEAASHPDVLFDNPTFDGTLPGGNAINFQTTYSSAESTPQPQLNAVNFGEWAQFDFELFGNNTFADLQSQILDEFNVGIHVRRILVDGYTPPPGEDDWSDSFAIVPLPAASWAGMATLAVAGAVGGLRRRRRSRAAL